jgi:hypothetical protein
VESNLIQPFSFIIHLSFLRPAPSLPDSDPPVQRPSEKANSYQQPEARPGETAVMDRFADSPDVPDLLWEEEWKANLLDRALKRFAVRAAPSPIRAG